MSKNGKISISHTNQNAQIANNRFAGLRFLTAISMIVLAAGLSACSDDSSTSGLTTTCGNGELDANEICDGNKFKDGVKVCPDGLILKDEAAFKCTDTCGIDISKACAAPSCGDGVLTGGEVCDGDQFRDGVKVCPTGMVELETPVWGCTKNCVLDITNACKVHDSGNQCQENKKCGNGELDEGETCDGSSFKDGVKVCPSGMDELETPTWGCTQTCQLDITNACKPHNTDNKCGNGELDEGEVCDGLLFAEGAKTCPSGYKVVSDRDLFRCHECALDTKYACIPDSKDDPLLYISEIRIISNESRNALAHLYIEIGNLGEPTVLDDCKVVGIKLDSSDNTKIDNKYVFEHPLAGVVELLETTIPKSDSADEPASKNVVGVCYEPTDGWIQGKYDENTLSSTAECYAIYDSYYELVVTIFTDLWDNCINKCNGDKNCIKSCDSSYGSGVIASYMNKYESERWNCIDEIEYKSSDEACHTYIPSSNNNLVMSLNKQDVYHSEKLWGIGVVCGETMHDMIKLDNWNMDSGSRICPIHVTGDSVSKALGDDQFYMHSSDESYGYAYCGQAKVN